MDYKKTVKNIYKAIESNPDSERGYEDAQSLFVLWVEEDSKGVIKNIGKFRDLISSEIERCLKRGDIDDAEDYRKLLYNSYLITAKYVFEDYLIALEFDRPAPEKFYLPRRKILKEVVEALQELEEGGLDELFLSMPPRVGKLLADSTPILTTKGWKNHGDLVVGDELFSPNGNTTRVIAVHPKNHTTHTVTFSDGTQIKCHFRHEWKVYDSRTKKTRILETQAMIGDIARCTDKGIVYNYSVIKTKPIEGEKKYLPCNPYTYGYLIDSKTKRNIPCCYLTASKEDRLKLIAGIIDSGGSVCEKGKYYIYTVEFESLKNDIVSLCRSFGWKVRVRNCGLYRISIYPSLEIPVSIKKKELNKLNRNERLEIVSIEPSEPEQGNCISVEGDGMYLAGYDMIPTHNTSILMFYETWLIGKDSEKHNLYCSYSDIITKAFFSGVLEILNDPVTYKWGEIFPNVPLQSTNADEETINTGRYKRYKSLTCRSLYGTLNGACDANGTLIADDLIGSIEEAMNKDRLLNAWSKVDNNMIPRAKEKCKLLWCGTRWSMIDPIGLREDLLKNDEGFKKRRYKIIDLPALDDKDESNFDYSYGVGFSTDYYRQRRASFERNNDIPSWQAQYMTQPIERAGAVFESGDMRMYNGELPESEPDRTFMVVDPAWGGGDFVSAPVCKQYGDDIYVCDVVYTNEDKSVSQPTIAQIAAYNGVDKIQIEANKMTDDFRIGIDDALKRIEYHCPVIAKPAPNNIAKEQRIFDKAPDIKEHFIFLEDGKRNKPYTLFMQNVFSFKILGNNKHDDAPDSLSMAAEEAFPKKVYTKISIFNRRF